MSRRTSRRHRGGARFALSPAPVSSVIEGPKLENVDIGADNQESVDFKKAEKAQGGFNEGQLGGKRHKKSRRHSKKRGGSKKRVSRKHRRTQRKSRRHMRGGAKTGCGC